ncbi:MAG: c-type cytochrome [Coleofasciculaceae cyanobacterium SM2_3_26]|nr:c-type cytochrome [Coleofasciculaceae cyanobacterium SM2_3_26]
MKKILSVILLAVTAAVLFFANPAVAADAAAGAAVFKAQCISCHANGKNTVNPAKTLKKADLEKYGMYSMAAVVNQVTNGKAAMPAFGKTKRLKPEQIENVAAYVLEQAEAGWNK